MNRPITIRNIPFLADEKALQMFDSANGMTSEDTSRNELYVLTTHRLLFFPVSNNGSEFSVVPLDKIAGFSRKTSDTSKNVELLHRKIRSTKSLYQGLSFIFGGILSYLVLGYNSDSLTIAITIGIALSLLGLLLVGRYIVHRFELAQSNREEQQDFIINAGSIFLKLTCTTKQAGDQISDFINVVMRTKANL